MVSWPQRGIKEVLLNIDSKLECSMTANDYAAQFFVKKTCNQSHTLNLISQKFMEALFNQITEEIFKKKMKVGWFQYEIFLWELSQNFSKIYLSLVYPQEGLSSRIQPLVYLGKELIFSLRLISLQRAYDDVNQHEEILLMYSLKRSKSWLKFHDLGGFLSDHITLGRVAWESQSKKSIQFFHVY